MVPIPSRGSTLAGPGAACAFAAVSAAAVVIAGAIVHDLAARAAPARPGSGTATDAACIRPGLSAATAEVEQTATPADGVRRELPAAAAAVDLTAPAEG